MLFLVSAVDHFLMLHLCTCVGDKLSVEQSAARHPVDNLLPVPTGMRMPHVHVHVIRPTMINMYIAIISLTNPGSDPRCPSSKTCLIQLWQKLTRRIMPAGFCSNNRSNGSWLLLFWTSSSFILNFSQTVELLTQNACWRTSYPSNVLGTLYLWSLLTEMHVDQ